MRPTRNYGMRKQLTMSMYIPSSPGMTRCSQAQNVDV